MLARQISFFAPAAVMAAWATVMLHTVASGHINRLLSPMFRNYVFIAAIVLLVLSALYVLLYRPTEEAAPAFAPTGRLRQFGRWLVLLVPLIAAAIFSPSALSSTTMQNRGLTSTVGVTPMPSWAAASQASAKEALDTDPNLPAPVVVTDLITVSKSAALMKQFDGRKVECIGFIVTPSGGQPKLVRGLMWCCAADIQPVSVDLTGDVPSTYKDTDWLQVTGTALFPSQSGHVAPQIKVDSVKPTQEPDEPYLSP